MEAINSYEGRLTQVTMRFNLMVALVFGLLLTNLVLAILLWLSFHNQRIEVTPFNSSNSYFKSQTQVDAHYLDMMSENFIYARLNITPGTVDAAHKRLLSFIDPQSYGQVLQTLNKEAAIIKSKKIASTFVIADLQTDLDTLTTKVTGSLRRTVATRALKEERLIYTLLYAYSHGRLTILSFTREKAHA